MRVLLIDDEPLYYKIIAPELDKAGYELEYAKSGLKGLETISVFNPDLLIVDLKLSDIDGFEIVQRLRHDPHFENTPVVFITSHTDLGDKLKAFELGVDDYLIKPFEPEELVARLGILARRGQAIKIVQQMETKKETSSTLVAFHSLRGGVGCSSLAVNFSLAMNSIWEKPTLLVDAILSSGQVAMMLNASPKSTLENCLNVPLNNIDDSIVEELICKYKSGLQYVAAPKYPVATDTFTQDFWNLIIGKFKRNYDYIVVDVDHDFSDMTISLLNLAKYIFLVVTPEMASLRAAVNALYIYDYLDFNPEKVKVILNHNTNITGIKQVQLEKALGHKFDFVLPFEPNEVLRAINFGEPFFLKDPELPLSSMIEDLAYAVSDPVHKNLPPAAPTAAWKRVNNRLAKNT